MRYRNRRRRGADLRRRLASRGALLLVATLAWSDAAATTLDVAVQDGLVSIEARNAPLGEVLQAVATAAGFSLVAKEGMPAPVNWSLRDVPVEQAVVRLLGRASFVSLYAPSDGRSEPALAEVRVLRAPSAVAAVVVRGADQPRAWDGQVAALEAATDAATTLDHPQAPAAADIMPASARRDLPNALSAKDPATRRAAAAGLAKLRPEAARGPLTEALSDPDGIVRLRAVQGLTRIGGEETIASLSKVLLEDDDPRVRRLAARGLGQMNTESAFWALMEANSDEDPGVREAVTQALGSLEKRGLNVPAR